MLSVNLIDGGSVDCIDISYTGCSSKTILSILFYSNSVTEYYYNKHLNLIQYPLTWHIGIPEQKYLQDLSVTPSRPAKFNLSLYSCDSDGDSTYVSPLYGWYA